MERFARIGAGWLATCVVGGIGLIAAGLLTPADTQNGVRILLLVAGGVAVTIGIVGVVAEFLHHPTPDPYDPSGGRAVVGKLSAEPTLLAEDVVPLPTGSLPAVTLGAAIRFLNGDSEPIACVIQRLDVSVSAHHRITPTKTIVGSRLNLDWDEPEIRIIPEPTHAWIIDPGKWWNVRLPHTFGPYPASNVFDVAYNIEIRVSRQFAKAAAIEYRRLSFTVATDPSLLTKGEAIVPDEAIVEADPPRFVAADVSDESADWWTYGPDRPRWRTLLYRVRWRISRMLPWTDKGLG